MLSLSDLTDQPIGGPWIELALRGVFVGLVLICVVRSLVKIAANIEWLKIMRHYDGFMKKSRIRGRQE